MEDPGGEGEALERSDDDDDTLSEDEGKHDEDEDEDEEEDEDVGAGAKDEERRLLDELEGLEEAEEEEYSGPLLAEEEDDDNEADEVPGEQDDAEDVDEDVDDEEHELAHADEEAEAEAADGEPSRHEEEEEEEEDIDNIREGVLDFLTQSPELDPGTPEEQAEFSCDLERFFASRCMDYRAPKFYGENLNLLKLWRTVIRLGAYNYVTVNKLWRQVGESFNPPKKCTTVSWSFRIFYEKSLLEYERYMLRGTGYTSGQRSREHLEIAEGSTGVVQSEPAQPSGRARRDAALRAMQGWHSQKLLENEDIEPAITKERSSLPSRSREKQGFTGTRKRRKFSMPNRSFKTARYMNGARPHMLADDAAIRDENGNHGYQSYDSAHRKPTFKQNPANQVIKSSNHSHVNGADNHSHVNGADIRVADEGPEADWVKINVHKTVDCFEVYALVPGLLQEELRIQCEPGGLLVIIGEPEKLNNPWGVTPFKKVIKLPSPIDANSTSAVITLHGQLFVRVPYGESHS